MKYRLACGVTVSAYTAVDAQSLAEAIEIAKEREVVISTGHDGAEESEQWIIDDADGSPNSIHESK